MWNEESKSQPPPMMPMSESEFKKHGHFKFPNQILMDGEQVDLSILAGYFGNQIPSLCQAIAEFRYKDAEIALSIAGTKKTYFSLFDNMKSPFLLLITCEDIYRNFNSIDVYDEYSKSSSSSSFSSSSSSNSISSPSRHKCYNLSAIYMQILDDMGKIYDVFSPINTSSSDEMEEMENTFEIKDFLPFPSSCSSNFSFISMNSSQSASMCSHPSMSPPIDVTLPTNDVSDVAGIEGVEEVEDEYSEESSFLFDHEKSSSSSRESDDSQIEGGRFSSILHMLEEVMVLIGIRVAMINIYKSFRLCETSSSLSNIISVLSDIEEEVNQCAKSEFTSPGIKLLLQDHILCEARCLKSIVYTRTSILAGQYIESILACQTIDTCIQNWKDLQLKVGGGGSHKVPAGNTKTLPGAAATSTQNGVPLHPDKSRRFQGDIKHGSDSQNFTTTLRWAILCQKRLFTLIYFIFQERKKKTVALIGGYGVTEKSVLTESMFVLPPSMMTSKPRRTHGTMDNKDRDAVVSGRDEGSDKPKALPQKRQPIRSQSSSDFVSESEERGSMGIASGGTPGGLTMSSSNVDFSTNGDFSMSKMSADASIRKNSRQDFRHKPLHLDNVIPHDEEINHVIDAFYKATQHVFSRSILVIVSIAESPLFSTPEEGQEWIIKQKQSFTCPPCSQWNTPMCFGEPLSMSAYATSCVNEPFRKQRRSMGGGSLQSQTGLVLLSKLLPSQKLRASMKAIARSRLIPMKAMTSTAPRSGGTSKAGMMHSDSFSTMASALSSAAVVTSSGASSSSTTNLSTTNANSGATATTVPVIDSTESMSDCGEGSNKSKMDGAKSSDQKVDADDVEGSNSSSDDDIDDDNGGGRLQEIAHGKNWIQHHLQGIGEMISALYPHPTITQLRRDSRGGGSAKLAFEATHVSPPRSRTPPNRGKSIRNVAVTSATDGLRESNGGGIVPSISPSSSSSATDYLPTKEVIRTCCGLDRSAGYRCVRDKLGDPTGAYFFAPLNEIDDMNNGRNWSTPSDTNENVSRLFLVGATFNPVESSDESSAITKDGLTKEFKDRMLDHLLSIGTFLRVDDLFVDVGKTKRHS